MTEVDENFVHLCRYHCSIQINYICHSEDGRGKFSRNVGTVNYYMAQKRKRKPVFQTLCIYDTVRLS